MSKSKKHDHEEHIDESWLIPYADLLTLLLALFIILFASSQIDAKKYDTVMKSLNAAFTGGADPFETSTLVPINDEANMTTKASSKPDGSQKQTGTGSGAAAGSAGTGAATDAAEAQRRKEEEDLSRLKVSLDRFIADNGLSGQLTTNLSSEKLMVTISDRALFDSGSATVKTNAKALAQAMAGMLGEYPGYRIEVAGHTDNQPIRNAEFDTNWDLSAKRALNFMKILLDKGKIDPSLFYSVGYGEYHPVADNGTAEGRAANRRVEVSILRHLSAKEGG
ncbi:OmpA family protein [Paenibacillus athensensis]|uniref:Flagellar motor protein MotB n=1 Tax=Paenibacillus athensensis TaxID=1967502 RepID=A0A4Y8Q3Q4_9BACL|nr:flagellar motor protein MotB [Paenibacillus athensensis]MCD1258360.1 OmpA family protein [Paenibacillus athensensis]